MGRKRTSTPAGISIGIKSIIISFQYKYQQCREIVPNTTTNAQSVKYAIRYKAEIEALIERGEFVYSDKFPDSRTKHAKLFGQVKTKLTIDDLFKRCGDFTSIVESETTARKYLQASYITRSALGMHMANDLQEYHIRDWIKKQSHLKRKTISNYLIPLGRALEMAVQDKILKTNPLAQITTGKRSLGLISPEQRKKAIEVDPFSVDEVDAIILAAGDYNEAAKNIIETAFFTGLRISELLGLKWINDQGDENIDFVNRRLSVNKALVTGTGGLAIWKNTKTSSGNRIIDLTENAFEALKRQQKISRFHGGVVFPRFDHGVHGKFDNLEYSDHYAKPWRTILRQAQVKYRPMKQTRHTFASQMLIGGETLLYVSSQLGHKDISMTSTAYARFIINDSGPKIFKATFGKRKK